MTSIRPTHPLAAPNRPPHRLEVLHVITGLNVGGAEMMLLRLLTACDSERFKASVLSLLPPGELAHRIEALSVQIDTISMARSLPKPAHLRELWRFSGRAATSLVQGWMYHGNLAGTLVWWRQRRRPRLIWNIRHSLDTLSQESSLTRRVIGSLARFSRYPDAIIYCSRVSQHQHEDLGFRSGRSVLIPNGFDSAVFRPDAAARSRLCALTRTPEHRPLLGTVARVDPQKDHANLIRAAALVRRQGTDAQLVLIGRGADEANVALNAIIRDSGLVDRVSMLGVRHDVPELLPGLDLLVSPSAWGEAFPNVVGEAMASGVPCVVTDVGDSGWLVADTGEVVPPRSPSALAASLCRLLSLPRDARQQLGEKARARIVEHFALDTAIRHYEDLYVSVSGR
jgi:glycosyltransferase involved in cell wall biosynthesis